MQRWIPGFLVALVLTTLQARAVEVAGVTVPDNVELDGGTSLQLNGAGVRSKFFIKVYVGALYLAEKASRPEQVYAMPGAKRVSMYFLYDEVSREKLVAAWKASFADNLSTAEYTALKPRIDAFNALFPTVHVNDTLFVEYQPEVGTTVWFNGERQGTVAGADFNTALLKIWLGEEPADSDLKGAMLGGD